MITQTTLSLIQLIIYVLFVLFSAALVRVALESYDDEEYFKSGLCIMIVICAVVEFLG